MEEIKGLVVSGCRLAKELESDVLNAYSPAEDLPEKCQGIARIFRAVSDRLLSLHSCHVADAQRIDWHTWQEDVEPNSMPRGEAPVGPGFSKGKEVITLPCKRRGVAEDSSFQLTTRARNPERKEGGKKRVTTVELVEAPLQGNTEIAPDDGFTWRKYGQKEILNALFPRAYYRCTHQKLYGCPAKKQVQRDDNNPHVFQVTYRGHHTCHISSTAPTAAPPPPAPTNNPDMLRRLPPTTSGSYDHTRVLRIGSAMGEGRDEGEYHATVVADMADAMFNFINGGGGNTMDFIFSDSKFQDGKIN